jgi:integrase
LQPKPAPTVIRRSVPVARVITLDDETEELRRRLDWYGPTFPFELVLENMKTEIQALRRRWWQTRQHHTLQSMHRSRYTAGQRILDATGNLKAAQALLGHASISRTADTYTDWDVERLESSLRQTFASEAGEWPLEIIPPSSDKIPANSDFMEAAGIEPASAAAPSERLRA